MARRSADEATTPFLKWAGGKRALLEQIRPHLPRSFGRYYEPFVGSAALFFSTTPRRATLSDTNARLVATFRGLRDATDEVIERLKRCRYNRAQYLTMRARDIDREGDAAIAAWFIYLNKTGYNGLYRVNSQNGFNVPFGRYSNPTICDEENLRACAASLRTVSILHADFERATSRARPGDFVYFDPPYVPLSATSSFTSYTADGFDHDAQLRLRDHALTLARRGVHVLVSNSSAKAVVDLYGRDFDLVTLRARRSINSKGSGRRAIAELLVKSRTF